MPPRNILIPVDGSSCAISAVSYADDLADKCGANLNLLYVLQPAESYILPEHLEKLVEETGGATSEADRILDAATDCITLCDRTRVSSETREGDPAGEIVRFCREKGIDLIVMGNRGMGDLKGLLLGSVSHKVVQAAECPCLLYRDS
jgi:nucleotide-binding universal stress UspA family protein